MKGVMSGTYDSMIGLLAIRRVIKDDRNARNANNIMKRIFECICLNGGLFLVSPPYCPPLYNLYLLGLDIGLQSRDPQMALLLYAICFRFPKRNGVFDVVLVGTDSLLLFLSVLGFTTISIESCRKCLMVSGICLSST